MKYEKGFKQEPKKKSWTRFLPHVPSHAPCQIILTLLQITTASLAVVFVGLLFLYNRRLNANYEGELEPLNDNNPCARQALPACMNPDSDDKFAFMDRCTDKCCPEGYMCIRDPTVGIFCQDRMTACGNFDFCLDVADVPNSCEREECQRRMSMTNMAFVVFGIASLAFLVDLVDLICCCVCADSVCQKSTTNFIACLAKWLAFGGLMGVGTEGFLTDHIGNKCFNPSGMESLRQAHVWFQCGSAMLFISGALSLCLVPMSAMFGGRLWDKPMNDMKVMDLGG